MNFFSSEYHEAREKFLVAAEAYGLRNVRFRLAHEASSELFLDFAFVKRNPKRLVLHLSGVHGIEGYVGSAIQSAILAEESPRTDASLLFAHAVNPYGMQFHRRANGQNVDLNRNYARERLPNPDYALFNSYLNPRTRLEFITGKISGFYQYKKLGRARSAQAVASGQYAFPAGLFYMGENVQREIQLLQEILRSHFSEVEEAIVIDVHSGLGPPGDELLFADEDVDPGAGELFSRLFGRPTTTPDPGEGSYINQGRLSGALRAALPDAKLHYVLQEFGTYPFGKVLDTLRRENFEWQANGSVAGASSRTQEKMREVFCPSDPKWRENSLRLGRGRWQQAVAHFSRT